MNKHLMTGNLVKDPEFKITDSGKSRCSFIVACQRPFKNAEGKYEADFITCVAWGKTAEFIHTYFTKGQSIELEGWVRVDKYTDKAGNTKWSNTTIVTHAMFNGFKRDKDTIEVSSQNYADIPNQSFDEDIEDEDLPF